jgi:polar amino acid transport system permease protein
VEDVADGVEEVGAHLLASLDWSVLWQRIFHPDHEFVLALWRTIYIAVAAQLLGVILGLIAALMRMSRLAPLRLLSGLYVLIFRGTPVIVQIFFVFYGANLLLGVTIIPNSVNLGVFQLDGKAFAGILALGINEGAYMREIFRAGIDSIDKGQMEAAKSLGMPSGLAMRRIILPQAARVIVPPLGNEFNNMIKTTSLVAFIGVTELFQNAEIGLSQTFKPVEYFLSVAFWYLVLTAIWSVIQAWIERKLAVSERGEELSWRERIVAAWTPVAAWGRGAR